MKEFKVIVKKGYFEVSVFKFIRVNGLVSIVDSFGFKDPLLEDCISYSLEEGEGRGSVEIFEEDEAGFDEEVEYTWEVEK